MTRTGTDPEPGADDLLDKLVRGARIVLDGAQAETGATPHEVVWSRNKARLYRYRSERERRHRVPVLFVYALLNRPYCLDLMPGNSFVEFLVDEGFDVYLLDWGIPGPEDRDQSVDDLVLDFLPRAVRRVLRCAGTDEFTLFGYCMGGTLSLMYAALHPEGLRNLILLATPVDCAPEHTGLYGQWFAERNHDPAVLAEAYGALPARVAYTGTAMLNPVTNYVGKYVSMWEMILRDKPMTGWLAMSKWADEPVPMPGRVYQQWVELYQHNRLATGELRLRGRRVDLSTITAPLLDIAGRKDHLVFLPQTEAAMDLVGSTDKEFVVLEAGHVGLLTGRGAKKGLWPEVRDWLEPPLVIADVRGRAVLVVGGGRGIGLAIATRFAELGADVGLTARDGVRAGEIAAALADAHSAKVSGHALDVTDRSRLRRVVAEFRGDVLIYNAGISPSYASAEKVTESDWDDILATNLTGAFCAAQAFARPLIERQEPGCIVFIGSVTSVVGDARLVAYTASKAGLAGMARTMALDWARHGIRVNTVAPGYVATDLTAGLQGNERLLRSLTDRTPQGRFADPREIADLVVFLASDSAGYVTGGVYPVDGGWTAR